MVAEDLLRDAILIVVFVLGALFGYKLHGRKRVPPPVVGDDEETVKVKRTKPSLRNPMRTYDVKYEDFKTKRGLYEPVRPRGAEKELEV